MTEFNQEYLGEFVEPSDEDKIYNRIAAQVSGCLELIDIRKPRRPSANHAKLIKDMQDLNPWLNKRKLLKHIQKFHGSFRGDNILQQITREGYTIPGAPWVDKELKEYTERQSGRG